jgi:hypothetical protein
MSTSKTIKSAWKKSGTTWSLKAWARSIADKEFVDETHPLFEYKPLCRQWLRNKGCRI